MTAFFKPRRGKKSTAESQNIVLKRGEVFFESPTGGVGTGIGRIKVGDGTTPYTSLPYFMSLDSFPSNKVTFDNTGTDLSSTNVEGAIKELESKITPVTSHIGMIIHTTTLDTEAKVKEIYGGTTWIQHSGYMLRGATSGVIANSAVKTDGEDTHILTVDEMPSHTHIQNSHNHTQNSHNHTQNSHNHTQNSHNHTQNAHNHAISGLNSRGSVASYWCKGNKNGDWGSGNSMGEDLISIGNKTATNNATTATNIATTATNNATTATNIATTATNQNTGGGKAHNNLPCYKSVYIWERTA
jgi:microcystin-dependent protein